MCWTSSRRKLSSPGARREQDAGRVRESAARIYLSIERLTMSDTTVNLRRAIFSERAKDVLFGFAILGVVAGIACAIVFPVITWQRGIYAGFHYNDAQSYVQDVMARNEGLAYSKEFRLATPNVINTHTTPYLYGTSGQVRIFHLIGPRGVKWCVAVWDGGYSWNRDYKITKGCRF